LLLLLLPCLLVLILFLPPFINALNAQPHVGL
jgi:hypothetical protein